MDRGPSSKRSGLIDSCEVMGWTHYPVTTVIKPSATLLSKIMFEHTTYWGLVIQLTSPNVVSIVSRYGLRIEKCNKNQPIKTKLTLYMPLLLL